MHITYGFSKFQQRLHLVGYPNSLVPYHYKRELLWLFNVVGNSRSIFKSWSKGSDIFVRF